MGVGALPAASCHNQTHSRTWDKQAWVAFPGRTVVVMVVVTAKPGGRCCWMLGACRYTTWCQPSKTQQISQTWIKVLAGEWKGCHASGRFLLTMAQAFYLRSGAWYGSAVVVATKTCTQAALKMWWSVPACVGPMQLSCACRWIFARLSGDMNDTQVLCFDGCTLSLFVSLVLHVLWEGQSQQMSCCLLQYSLLAHMA